MINEHREDYPKKDDFRIDAVRLRDQITSPARTILLVLLAASALVFVIACSNVANLILARSVRREGELAIRAALGATAGALRRTLLAESLVLCGAGAALGVADRLADGRGARAVCGAVLRPRARSLRGRHPAVGRRRPGAGLRRAPRVRAPAAVVRRGERLRPLERQRPDDLGHQPAAAPVRGHADRRVVRPAGRRRHAADDAVRAAAGANGHATRATCWRCTCRSTTNARGRRSLPLYKEAIRRISALPGVEQVSVGTLVPWREAGAFFAAQFTVEGYAKADGEEDPRGTLPHHVAELLRRRSACPLLAGRDFNDATAATARKS